jgi:hypothetical protein
LVNAVAERKDEMEQIKLVFEDMMSPSEEARHGIAEFRSGSKTVDWRKWYSDQDFKAKL